MPPTATLRVPEKVSSEETQPRPLRILHLCSYYSPFMGGVERAVRTLAQGLAGEGLRVRVLTVNHRTRQGRNAVFSSTRSTAPAVERDGRVLVIRLGRLGAVARLECAAAVPVLARLLRTYRPDVIHLHAPNPLMELSLALLGTQIPRVITYHCDIVRPSALYPLQRLARREVFGRADRILVTSPAYAFSGELSPYPDKCSVVPLGLSLEPFLAPGPRAKAYARHLRALCGEPLWLTVSRLVPCKGLELALAALRSVPGKLVIVGEGPLEKSLRLRTANEGVSDRVVWLGHLDDEQLAGAYQAATALWFPSHNRSEAFGLVQVEAMASGCPVINCDIPGSGVSWVSRHEESGLTISPNDPVALSRAARRLSADALLRAHLGARGQARARAEFAAEMMVDRTLDIYHEVLRSAGSRTARLDSPGGCDS